MVNLPSLACPIEERTTHFFLQTTAKVFNEKINNECLCLYVTCIYVCLFMCAFCRYVHICSYASGRLCGYSTYLYTYFNICLLPLLPVRVGTKDQICFILSEIHIAKDDVSCFLVLKSYQHSFLKHPAVSLHCLMKVMKKSNKGKKKRFA